MLRKVLLALGIIVIIFIGIVAMQPNEFRVERSVTINAPAPAVFAKVNDLRQMNEWSPWAQLDPNATMTFAGPAAGVGSSFSWVGNKNVGEGIETIIESRPNELVKLNLEFIKPFKGTNTVEFIFKPQGNATLVTWLMYGKSNFISKAMGLLMNCDKMIGGQFEKGLSSLKALVESK